MMNPPINDDDDDRTPLLLAADDHTNAKNNPDPNSPQSGPYRFPMFDRNHLPVHRRLYISHFLSTWNSRVFEFGAVLYLAALYPDTFLPLSLYAFVRGLSAIAFAPLVGWYIDSGDRMSVVRVSIVGQRLVVAISCVIFYLAIRIMAALDRKSKGAVVGVVTLLACVEKVCSILNLVSVEKDWVVVVANADQAALRTLNAEMRRIDLICKLLGPLFIALLDGYSTQLAILVNLGMNTASVFVEYPAVAQVYHQVPALQIPKNKQNKVDQTEGEEEQAPDEVGTKFPLPTRGESRILRIFKMAINDFILYIHHQAFAASFSGALLYLTVLSFSGQMVTYLLAAGYSSTLIGISRTLSVALEILATWVAPWLIGRIGPVQAGFWLSNWQVVMLAAGILVFWMSGNTKVSVSGLVGGTILSRVGLRGFDLCAQIIVQNDVEAEFRGTFSSIEAGWQSGFELLAYASTMVFSRTDQFRWPALISAVAVTSASGVYTVFVYFPRRLSARNEVLPA